MDKSDTKKKRRCAVLHANLRHALSESNTGQHIINWQVYLVPSLEEP